MSSPDSLLGVMEGAAHSDLAGIEVDAVRAGGARV